MIAAAVDPSHGNDKPSELDHHILDCARCMAKPLEGEVHALHAYFPALLAAAVSSGSPPMFIGVPPEALVEEERAKRAELWALAKPYGVAEANIHLETGIAVEFLPRVAQECGADVVVMGAIARSGVKRIFLGSTAERVLETLPCDVLVIKPHDFANRLPF